MLLELALAAAIQSATTTTCNTFLMGTVRCETERNNTGSGMDAYNAARESAMRDRQLPPAETGQRHPGYCARSDWFLIGCTMGEHRDAEAFKADQERLGEVRERALRYLEQGDCQAAVGAALQGRDLQLATDIRAFCAAGPSTPST